MKRFEQGKSSLRIEKELLLQQARLNLEERTAQRLEAVELFNANSEALYDAPGRLTVDVGPNGFPSMLTSSGRAVRESTLCRCSVTT